MKRKTNKINLENLKNREIIKLTATGLEVNGHRTFLSMSYGNISSSVKGEIPEIKPDSNAAEKINSGSCGLTVVSLDC